MKYTDYVKIFPEDKEFMDKWLYNELTDEDKLEFIAKLKFQNKRFRSKLTVTKEEIGKCYTALSNLIKE